MSEKFCEKSYFPSYTSRPRYPENYLHGTYHHKNPCRSPNNLMDDWLDFYGFYRRHIPYDKSALFRCVADQVYYTQALHERLKKVCVNYMRRNKEQFVNQLSTDVDDHIDQLNNDIISGGNVEMNVLSRLVRRDFIIYKEIDERPQKVTSNGYENFVYLCFSKSDHYDSIFTLDYIEMAGICQSIVYDLLYTNVFDIVDAFCASKKMLYEYGGDGKTKLFQRTFDPNFSGSATEALNRGLLPFPYKVAKSLDPALYRNIEFDAWLNRKQSPARPFSDDFIRVGTKCNIILNNDSHHPMTGYVQRIAPNFGPVTVFIEDLGEQRTVPYFSLQPVRTTNFNSLYKERTKLKKFNRINQDQWYKYQDYNRYTYEIDNTFLQNSRILPEPILYYEESTYSNFYYEHFYSRSNESVEFSEDNSRRKKVERSAKFTLNTDMKMNRSGSQIAECASSENTVCLYTCMPVAMTNKWTENFASSHHLRDIPNRIENLPCGIGFATTTHNNTQSFFLSPPNNPISTTNFSQSNAVDFDSYSRNRSASDPGMRPVVPDLSGLSSAASKICDTNSRTYAPRGVVVDALTAPLFPTVFGEVSAARGSEGMPFERRNRIDAAEVGDTSFVPPFQSFFGAEGKHVPLANQDPFVYGEGANGYVLQNDPVMPSRESNGYPIYASDPNCNRTFIYNAALPNEAGFDTGTLYLGEPLSLVGTSNCNTASSASNFNFCETKYENDSLLYNGNFLAPEIDRNLNDGLNFNYFFNNNQMEMNAKVKSNNLPLMVSKQKKVVKVDGRTCDKTFKRSLHFKNPSTMEGYAFQSEAGKGKRENPGPTSSKEAGKETHLPLPGNFSQCIEEDEVNYNPINPMSYTMELAQSPPFNFGYSLTPVTPLLVSPDQHYFNFETCYPNVPQREFNNNIPMPKNSNQDNL